MNIVRAFIGVDGFEVQRVAHHMILDLDAVGAVHVESQRADADQHTLAFVVAGVRSISCAPLASPRRSLDPRSRTSACRFLATTSPIDDQQIQHCSASEGPPSLANNSASFDTRVSRDTEQEWQIVVGLALKPKSTAKANTALYSSSTTILALVALLSLMVDVRVKSRQIIS